MEQFASVHKTLTSGSGTSQLHSGRTRCPASVDKDSNQDVLLRSVYENGTFVAMTPHRNSRCAQEISLFQTLQKGYFFCCEMQKGVTQHTATSWYGHNSQTRTLVSVETRVDDATGVHSFECLSEVLSGGPSWNQLESEGEICLHSQFLRPSCSQKSGWKMSILRGAWIRSRALRVKLVWLFTSLCEREIRTILDGVELQPGPPETRKFRGVRTISCQTPVRSFLVYLMPFFRFSFGYVLVHLVKIRIRFQALLLDGGPQQKQRLEAEICLQPLFLQCTHRKVHRRSCSTDALPKQDSSLPKSCLRLPDWCGKR